MGDIAFTGKRSIVPCCFLLSMTGTGEEMFISTAYASADVMAGAPTTGEAFMMNMLLILVLVALFYVLMIMPQQKRFKEHRAMLDSLKKGDKVLTAGGLIGKVDKIKDDNEVVVDLGNGIKVSALRSTIQSKENDTK